jgi:hypothetical protein
MIFANESAGVPVGLEQSDHPHCQDSDSNGYSHVFHVWVLPKIPIKRNMIRLNITLSHIVCRAERKSEKATLP